MLSSVENFPQLSPNQMTSRTDWVVSAHGRIVARASQQDLSQTLLDLPALMFE